MPRTPAFWQRRGAIARCLLPLAWLYCAVARLRRALYRSGRRAAVEVGVPVVIVGNLSAGGSGKTPLVIALVRALQQRGLRPGVVSRGYGRASSGGRQVGTDSDATEVGDEPLLIHIETAAPVSVNADRVAAARDLLARHPELDVIVADDGLQHYRLARDVELCVLPAAADNGWCLPAGPLREPLSRLTSVDIVFGTGPRPATLPPAVPYSRLRRELGHAWRVADPAETCPLDALLDRDWIAACGIARPDAFFAALTAAGVRHTARPFADHHAFRASDLPADAAVLMTTKDAVKCRSFAGRDWWAVTLALEIDPLALEQLMTRLRAPAPQSH